MTLLCRALDLATRPAAMAVSAALSAWWAVEVGTRAGLLDAIISGGALVFGQAIYREAAPRDDALHKKLDAIIHGTDADDELAEIEKEAK